MAYVSSGAPLPQNSLNAMPPSQRSRMQQCIDNWNLAAARAKVNAYAFPSPASGAQISPNLVNDMTLGQNQAQVAAYSILTNTLPSANSANPQGLGSPAATTNPMIQAPQVAPLNAAASAEYGCSWQGSVVPPAPQPAQRVFLQPAPNMPQILAAAIPQTAAPAPTSTGALVSAPPASGPTWSPCPPGVPYQGYYVGGAPVCGAIGRGGAVAPSGPGFARGYASIAGMGDSPDWSDAFSSYQSSPGNLLGMIQAHPVVALLIAAGAIFGLAAMGKR